MDWFGSEANLKQAKGKFQVSWFASLSPFIARHPLAPRLGSYSQPPTNQVPRSASFRHLFIYSSTFATKAPNRAHPPQPLPSNPFCVPLTIQSHETVPTAVAHVARPHRITPRRTTLSDGGPITSFTEPDDLPVQCKAPYHTAQLYGNCFPPNLYSEALREGSCTGYFTRCSVTLIPLNETWVKTIIHRALIFNI